MRYFYRMKEDVRYLRRLAGRTRSSSSGARRTIWKKRSSYVLEAMNEYIGDLEDVQIAEQRLADIRAGRSKTITLDELERNLGLAD